MGLRTRDMILTGLFAALTAVGAFIKIPTPLVPFTLQAVFSLYAGFFLGPRLGAMSQLLYVAVGLAGLPVFTGGGGIGYVLNPSFGYLLGFILCAYLAGKIIEGRKEIRLARLFAASLAGLFAVYLIGVPYLYWIMNLTAKAGSEISFSDALAWGLTPFIPVDLIKAAITAITAVKIVPLLRRYGLTVKPFDR